MVWSVVCHAVLWFSGKSYQKTFTRIIILVWWLGACKISAIQCKGTIFEFGVEWREVGK